MDELLGQRTFTCRAVQTDIASVQLSLSLMPTPHPVLPRALWNHIAHLLIKLVNIGLTLEQANHIRVGA